MKGFFWLEVSRDIDNYLKELSAKYDMEISPINIKESSGGVVQFYFNGSLKSIDGKSQEQLAFEEHCYSFGYTPEDYGKRYTSFDGKMFEFVGFNPRARKYPFLVKNLENGKIYKTSIVSIDKDKTV